LLNVDFRSEHPLLRQLFTSEIKNRQSSLVNQSAAQNLTSARHGVPRKTSSMMAAPWFSKIPDAARPTPNTTAAKNILGKAVWKATLTASETDRQNHHLPALRSGPTAASGASR